MLLVSGCGDSFVETNPPVLELLHVRTAESVREEPVILGVILDLQLPDPDACNAVSARFEDAFLGATKEEVRTAQRAPTLTLSPGCWQARDRRIDVGAYEAALVQVAQQLPPDAHPRPVILYINNIDARLSSGLESDLRGLRNLAAPLAPQLWGVTPGLVAAQVGFDQHVPWTWSDDPALLSQIVSRLDARLPFWTGRMPRAVDVLPDEVRARAVALKFCSGSKDLRDGTVTVDGRAALLDDPEATPFLAVAPLQDRVATPWPPSGLRELSWDVEVCTGNCDRATVEADGLIGAWWLQKVGCTLKEAP